MGAKDPKYSHRLGMPPEPPQKAARNPHVTAGDPAIQRQRPGNTEAPTQNQRTDTQGPHTGHSFDYKLKDFNFNPFTGVPYFNSNVRALRLRTEHGDHRKTATYQDNIVNNLCCSTAKYAFKCWDIRMNLRMASQVWDIGPILRAAANAAYAAATSIMSAGQWETESRTRMSAWLSAHSLNDYRRNDIRTDPSRNLSSEVLWTKPPAYPVDADRAWLWAVSLDLLAKLLQADAGCRRQLPQQAAAEQLAAPPTPSEVTEDSRTVVQTPGLSNYLKKPE